MNIHTHNHVFSLFCLRHPYGLAAMFSHTINSTHNAPMTLIDTTALQEQFHTQSISQHWDTCLGTLKFFLPTHSPWQAHRLSHLVLITVLFTITWSNSGWYAAPLPSHKYYFTRITSSLYRASLTHSFVQWISHTNTTLSLWLQLLLSHTGFHTHIHASTAFYSFFFTPSYQATVSTTVSDAEYHTLSLTVNLTPSSPFKHSNASHTEPSQRQGKKNASSLQHHL